MVGKLREDYDKVKHLRALEIFVEGSYRAVHWADGAVGN